MTASEKSRIAVLVHALAAVAPLLEHFVSIAQHTSLLNETTGSDREPLVKRIDGELRQVASRFDQLNRALDSAWRIFEGLLQSVESASSGQLAYKPSRRPTIRSRKALVRLGLCDEEKRPKHLAPDGIEWYRAGFTVRTANQLARLGLKSPLEIVVLHAGLSTLPGIGPSTIEEIRRVLAEIGIAPPIGPESPITLHRRPTRKSRKTLDWQAVSEKVREGLERLGGSGTLTNLLEQAPGLPHSRIKRGLAMLEKAGVVERSGVKRSTRYHLTSNKPEGSG